LLLGVQIQGLVLLLLPLLLLQDVLLLKSLLALMVLSKEACQHISCTASRGEPREMK
jgi:hypothetical protein